MKKILLIFAILFLSTGSLFADTAYDTVGNSYDDATEKGTHYITTAGIADYIYAYTDTTDNLYRAVGIRWANVAVPQGATVDSAEIEINVVTENVDDINCKIYGNDTDSCQDFNDNQHIIPVANRPRTEAYVSWVENDLGAGWVKKTGLGPVIQEIVNRVGFAENYPIALLFIPNDDGTQQVNINSYDKGAEYGARLTVYFTAGAEEEPVKRVINVSIKDANVR